MAQTSLDNKLHCLKDQFIEDGKTGIEGINRLNSDVTSSRKVCNEVHKRATFQDSVRRRKVQSKFSDVRDSGGHQYGIDLNESSSLSNNDDGECIEITSNFHPQSNSPKVRISEVHQSENDSIYSSSWLDKSGSACVANSDVIQSKSKMPLSSDNQSNKKISPTTLNAIRTRLNLMYGVPLNPPSDLKMRSVSQSAHAYSNNRIAAPSPANHAEMFHTSNALQENTPANDLLASSDQCSSNDAYPTFLKSDGKKLEVDHILMCSEWVTSLTYADACFSYGSYIHEKKCGSVLHSNSFLIESSISEEAQESDGYFIAMASSASEGSCAELQAHTAVCVKVSAVIAMFYHTIATKYIMCLLRAKQDKVIELAIGTYNNYV